MPGQVSYLENNYLGFGHAMFFFLSELGINIVSNYRNVPKRDRCPGMQRALEEPEWALVSTCLTLLFLRVEHRTEKTGGTSERGE